MVKEYNQKDFNSIDITKITNGKVVDVLDDIIVSTLDTKYGSNILERKVGVYGEYIDYRKTILCNYYYKLKDRLILIDICRLTTPLEYICKYWYLFKETKWLERNGFYDGKYLPIYFLMIFRQNYRNNFCSNYKIKLCEYISIKINDDLPNQPFLYHSTKLEEDDYLELRKMLEIISL